MRKIFLPWLTSCFTLNIFDFWWFKCVNLLNGFTLSIYFPLSQHTVSGQPQIGYRLKWYLHARWSLCPSPQSPWASHLLSAKPAGRWKESTLLWFMRHWGLVKIAPVQKRTYRIDAQKQNSTSLPEQRHHITLQMLTWRALIYTTVDRKLLH